MIKTYVVMEEFLVELVVKSDLCSCTALNLINDRSPGMSRFGLVQVKLWEANKY